jgi:hypothetical protein
MSAGGENTRGKQFQHHLRTLVTSLYSTLRISFTEALTPTKFTDGNINYITRCCDNVSDDATAPAACTKHLSPGLSGAAKVLVTRRFTYGDNHAYGSCPRSALSINCRRFPFKQTGRSIWTASLALDRPCMSRVMRHQHQQRHHHGNNWEYLGAELLQAGEAPRQVSVASISDKSDCRIPLLRAKLQSTTNGSF